MKESNLSTIRKHQMNVHRRIKLVHIAILLTAILILGFIQPQPARQRYPDKWSLKGIRDSSREMQYVNDIVTWSPMYLYKGYVEQFTPLVLEDKSTHINTIKNTSPNYKYTSFYDPKETVATPMSTVYSKELKNCGEIIQQRALDFSYAVICG